MRHLLNLFAVCSVALLSGIACATETDQFTLPLRPLDDLGPDLGAMVLAVLHSELSQLNAEERRAGVDDPGNPALKTCGWDESDTRDHQSYTSGARCCAYLP